MLLYLVCAIYIYQICDDSFIFLLHSDFALGCACDTIYASDPAKHTTQLIMTCEWTWACVQTTVYCPYQEVNACTLYIESTGTSVEGMEIIVPQDYKYGYLNIINDDPIEYTSDFFFTINCINDNYTIISQTNITYDDNHQRYICSSQDCCPWQASVCLDNEHCNISCSTQNCTNLNIDG